jgi:hypothetical protein
LKNKKGRSQKGRPQEVNPIKDIILDLLNFALDIWNGKLTEVWSLLTVSPTDFKGGTIWAVIQNIHGALQATGLALLVLFFAAGTFKTCGTFVEMKRPEQALKVFVRFAIAKGLVTYGMELMLALLEIGQGILSTVMSASTSVISDSSLPESISTAVEECSLLPSIGILAVSLVGMLVIVVLSFILILTVYGRMFRVYLYTAVAPIPLSAFAGEPTQQLGISFLKSYASVCLEGVIIALCCVIYSAYAASAPAVSADASAAMQVLTYIGELAFNMLVLVGLIKGASQVTREMMGI